ncbi:glycoside hydrolase family 2 protein [Persicobacter diffluens]|uniref:Beta-galactosidase n=1 Tax=Persicobacter diffluens TaxID=981 RepID=A0AAN4W1W7_9BACT|nr:hypothetical protein PEDI_36450 [Persicobacter diffluens]
MNLLNRFFWVSLFFLLISCQSHGPKEMSLNGSWNFLADNDITEPQVLTSDFTQWTHLPVPGNWDTQEDYSTYTGKGYYQRNFNIPADWKGKQVRIKFDAVYQSAKVWLNGQLLGTHVGGYTPFEFNISEIAHYNGENSLVVQADNTYSRGAWWPWGGISRSVSLLCNESVRIAYQHITATPDFERKSVDFMVNIVLENNANTSIQMQLQTMIASKALQKKVELAAGAHQTIKFEYTAPLTDFELWDMHHPNLYHLETKLIGEDCVWDVKQDHFGVRKIEAIGEQLFLNNKPIRLNGMNRVHDHPNFGNTEPDKLIKMDMDGIKALGGHFSRLMHAPLSKNLLNYCDSIGYLVIQEIPVWGDDDPQTFAHNPQTEQWMREMIQRDYNHPCVIGWSVGNELRDPVAPWGEKSLTKDQYAYVDSMLDFLTSQDSSRLKTYVSITAYGKYTDQTNEPYEKLDLICINSYGNAVGLVEKTHEKFPGKPIFLSEIGRKQIGGKPESELSEQLVNDLNILREYPYLVGYALWSYNDYRSGYKGTPKSGFREWGVVDAYRQPKKAFAQIKQINDFWGGEE